MTYPLSTNISQYNIMYIYRYSNLYCINIKTYHTFSLKQNKYITTSLSANATPKRPALSLSNGFLGPVQADDIFEPGTTKAGSFTNKDILPTNSGYLPAIYGMIGYFLEC